MRCVCVCVCLLFALFCFLFIYVFCTYLMGVCTVLSNKINCTLSVSLAHPRAARLSLRSAAPLPVGVFDMRPTILCAHARTRPLCSHLPSISTGSERSATLRQQLVVFHLLFCRCCSYAFRCGNVVCVCVLILHLFHSFAALAACAFHTLR